MWKLLTLCSLFVAAVHVAPSSAASMFRRDAEAVPTLRSFRHARSMAYGPYAGGSVDTMNHIGPMGPVDAYLDQTESPPGDDSSEESVDDLVAKLEYIKSDPTLDFATREEKVAELKEQIVAVEQATPAPVNPVEAAAEAQEQQPAPQVDPAQAEEQAAEAAEQAAPQQDPAPQPDPPQAASGPDNSNKEDGDGNGNSGADSGNNGNNGNGAEPAAQPDPVENNAGGGGGGGGDPPAFPTTPEPIPYEPPQNNNGNGNDQGNEDTKS